MSGSRKYLVNAFSLNMLDVGIIAVVELHIEKLTREEFCREIRDAESYIGHESTARLISEMCGFPVQANRGEIKLNRGDTLILFQLRKRLKEGAVLTAEELNKMVESGEAELLKVDVVELVSV